MQVKNIPRFYISNKEDAITTYKRFHKPDSATGLMYIQPSNKKHYFEVGKTYIIPRYEPKIQICLSGYHSCYLMRDVEYYVHVHSYSSSIFAEIKIWGQLDMHYDKVASSHMEIVKMVNENDILEKQKDISTDIDHAFFSKKEYESRIIELMGLAQYASPPKPISS